SFMQIAQLCKEQKRKFDYTCLGIQFTANTSLLFDAADKHHVKTISAGDFHLGDFEAGMAAIDEVLARSEHVYASICLDVFASAFSPGVSSPQPLGLYPWHVIPILEKMAASGKVVSMEIAELCPEYDRDGMSAQLAASLIARYVR